MKKCKAVLTGSLSLFLLSSCASFIKDDDFIYLKGYEKEIYQLNEDIEEGDHVLKKGQKVRIFIKVSKESIKVYCYPYDADFLKAERILILYLFEDDFENGQFDRTSFKENLSKIIQPQ